MQKSRCLCNNELYYLEFTTKTNYREKREFHIFTVNMAKIKVKWTDVTM